MALSLDIISHGVMCCANSYLILMYSATSSRWINVNRTLYILYGATGVVAYVKRRRRSVLNHIYNRLHDISYVCGSALTNVHIANQIATQIPFESKPSSLFWSSVLSISLPVFCFAYYVILRSEDYELTQSLCKASAFLTVLLGGSVNNWRIITSGIFYFMAYDSEVLKSQEDFFMYFRNAYNILVSNAQMLI